MTQKEFEEKYGLKFKDAIDEVLFFSVLDDLYLKFTKEQVIDMMTVFYDNADDIFNDIKQRFEEGLKKLEELFEDYLDKPGKAQYN